MQNFTLLIVRLIRVRIVLFFSLLIVASCSTTFIPGLDRLIFKDSSAKVGPVLKAEEAYPIIEDDNAQADTENGSEINERMPPANTMEVGGIDSTELPPISPGTEEPAPRVESTVKAAPQKPLLVEQKQIVTPTNTKPEQPILRRVASEPVKPKAVAKAKVAPKSITQPYGVVRGRVEMIDENDEPLPVQGTLVTLSDLSAKSTQKPTGAQSAPRVHLIDMRDKAYQPRFSAINSGDQVVFVNKDQILHNVFSSSGKNAFDLGTYGAGLKRAVTLEETGIVKVYCNIHADMATFIAVGNAGLSAKVDERGIYEFRDVPEGVYEMSIWNIRGESTRRVTVTAGKALELSDRVVASSFKVEQHKNKFGGNYSKGTVLFDDEFY